MYKKRFTYELFPTVVLEYNLNRQFTKQENSVFKSIDEMERNVGNYLSVNKYILNTPELEYIHNTILDCVNDYIETVYKPKNKLEPYVTQSWINVNERTGWHHLHNHANSFISGVLYLNADKNKDSIIFYNDLYRQISPYPREYTNYNSQTWKVSVGTGDIILFPSHLRHMVEANQSDNPRISLSFNVFVKGTLGKSEIMSELIL
jgi:uncharacterized protein (TIGR02466 family)